jgi:methylmalonyl-CoA/ethylmalonyl-CoA epimerase
MILGLDHVGLATTDAAGVGTLLDALGLRLGDSGLADEYGVRCDFWRVGDERVAVEVVAPARPGSTIDQRLEQAGPGLYHVAFRVDDIEAEVLRLRGLGFVAVDTRPCAGARPGMLVAFMYVRRPAAFMIELVQYDAS